MARPKLSLPHERRKMALRSAKMKHQVAIAEHRERLTHVNQELAAMRPTPPKKDVL
jgi:hypothetical protein